MIRSRLKKQPSGKISRRELLVDGLAAVGIGTTGALLRNYLHERSRKARVFIAKAGSYEADLISPIADGLRSLGIGPAQVRGKRILLKPNFVETQRGTIHICTRPEVVFAAVEVFRRLGAATVLIGEGPGHCRDTDRVLDEAQMAEALVENKTPFVDLNNDDLVVRPNAGGRSGLATLTLPATAAQADWIVSMPKMKTHHWVGVTLSMKNLFGLMPGIVYGWPKNVFHWAGIEQAILDIHATVKPQLAIIDGIVGMEGDGPIVGTPKHAGVLVMGQDLAAADATAARIMGIDPLKVTYLRSAPGGPGAIAAQNILQRGETIAAVRTDFQLLDAIPAHLGLRLAQSL
ncbi:MAG: DUF362 domain-containing protein [Phycisphaerae bacterium]|nr:DUF362 domain-containing protein [Phycisphaerae bacterium]